MEKRRRKLCFVTHGLGNSGIITFVINTINGIDLNQYELYLVMALDNTGTLQMREQEVLNRGVKIYRTCDLGNARRVLLHIKKLKTILEEENIDILHSNMDMFNGFNVLAARMAGVKIRIAHAHIPASKKVSLEGQSLKTILYHYFMKKLMWQCANRRCGCSENAMNYFYGSKWKSDPNSAIIDNGIDLNDFLLSTEELEHKLFKNEDKKTVLAVGRLTAQKNPFFMIEIIYELSKIRNDFQMIWVGTGELESQIKERIRKYKLENIIELVGWRNDVNKIMKSSEIFLLPSQYEGLPFVAIEAQAANLLCFVSDNIDHSMDCGLCNFIPLDKGAVVWANEISVALENKCAVHPNMNKLLRFSEQHMIAELEKVYKE